MRLPRGLSKLFTGNEALNQPVIIIVTDISFFIFVLIFFLEEVGGVMTSLKIGTRRLISVCVNPSC